MGLFIFLNSPFFEFINQTDEEIPQMIINDPKKKKREIRYLEAEKKIEIKNYLRSLVEKWCENTPEKSFKCSDLLENKEMWEKKPLVYMYNHYRIDKDENKEKAIKHDSVDVGWLLKEVILEMPQKFRAKRIFRKTYTYIPE